MSREFVNGSLYGQMRIHVYVYVVRYVRYVRMYATDKPDTMNALYIERLRHERMVFDINVCTSPNTNTQFLRSIATSIDAYDVLARKLGVD